MFCQLILSRMATRASSVLLKLLNVIRNENQRTFVHQLASTLVKGMFL